VVTEKSKQGLSKIYKILTYLQNISDKTDIYRNRSSMQSCSTQGRITNALPSTLVYDWELADSCLALYLRDAVYEVEDIE
jgi:hypothetical protein